MVRIALTFAALSLCLSACIIDNGGGDGSLSAQQMEQILEDARACGPTDQCIVVDTYCCPRPINADSRAAVEDAHERLDPAGSECLADCISVEDLTASCVDGLCSLPPF